MRGEDTSDWRPGDPLPDRWFLPTACPDGHPWGPGHVSMSYGGGVNGGYHTYCVPDPTDNRVHCRWRWHEPPRGEGEPRWEDFRS